MASDRHCKLLLLCPREKGDETDYPIILKSVSVSQRKVEPVGRAYEELIRRIAGISVMEEESQVGNDDSKPAKGEEDENKGPLGEEWIQSRRVDTKHCSPMKIDHDADLYGILELKQTWRSTPSEIKANCESQKQIIHSLISAPYLPADKRLITSTHPDKNMAVSDFDDARCQEIKDTFSYLSDPVTRLSYDSSLPFDDSTPKASQCARISSFDDFYNLFQPVFERNSMWSMDPAVPDLGTVEDSEEKIERFYDFWFGLRSWRLFSMEDEHDIDEAEYKQEKRWMQVENERQRRKKKKKEMSRIRSVVELARANDPRLKALKIRREEEKKRAEEEKRVRIEHERKQMEEEARRRKQQEKDEQEEEKRRRKREKKLMSKERGKLRKKIGDVNRALLPSQEIIEEYFLSLKLEELQSLSSERNEKILEEIAKYKGKREEEKASTTMLNIEEVSGIRRITKGKASNTPSERDNTLSEWQKEEIDTLVLMSKKFPVGTQDRWEIIREFLPNRKPKEIAAKAKEMRAKDATFLIKVEKEEVKRKGKRNKADVEDGPTLKFDRLESRRLESEEQENKKFEEGKGKKGGANTQGATAKAKWNPTEMTLLQVGLKKYPSNDNERWQHIGLLIGTKTAAECEERFNEIRAEILRRRQKAGAAKKV